MSKKYFTDESLNTLVSEIKGYTDEAVSAKADSSHSHDDIYYTEAEVDEKIAAFDDRIVAEDDGELTTELPEMFGGRTADEYALKSDLDNVGGASSWNDLEDKPFGENEDGTVQKMSGKYVEGMGYVENTAVTVIPEQTISFNPGMNKVSAENSFSVGDNVTVLWDGISYERVAVGLNGLACVGNAAIANMGENTGEPFLIGSQGENAMIFTTNPGECLVSANAVSEIIHPINRKLLPSGAGVVVRGKRYADGEQHSEPVTLEKTNAEIGDYLRKGNIVELWLYDWFEDSVELNGYNGSPIILRCEFADLGGNYFRFSNICCDGDKCFGWSYNFGDSVASQLVYFEITLSKTEIYGG